MNTQTQLTRDRFDLWTMAYQIEATLGALVSNDAFVEMENDHIAGTLWSVKDIATRLKNEFGESPAPTNPGTDSTKPATNLPSNYHSDSTLPEELFVLPSNATTEINTDFLKEQFERIYTIAWLLVLSSPTERGDSGAWDDTTVYQALCQILTHTRQADMIFKHCQSGGES